MHNKGADFIKTSFYSEFIVKLYSKKIKSSLKSNFLIFISSMCDLTNKLLILNHFYNVFNAFYISTSLIYLNSYKDRGADCLS